MKHQLADARRIKDPRPLEQNRGIESLVIRDRVRQLRLVETPPDDGNSHSYSFSEWPLGNGQLVALRGSDGRLQWSAPVLYGDWSSPAVSGDLVHVGEARVIDVGQGAAAVHWEVGGLQGPESGEYVVHGAGSSA